MSTPTHGASVLHGFQESMNSIDAAMECMDGARKGFTDARLRHDVRAEMDARRIVMKVNMARIEETVKRFEHAGMKHGGLRPEIEIPQYEYHRWAGHFKEKDLAAGITHTTGYECWAADSDFRKQWVKQNKQFQYREAKRCQQSSIIVPATKYTPARAA